MIPTSAQNSELVTRLIVQPSVGSPDYCVAGDLVITIEVIFSASSNLRAWHRNSHKDRNAYLVFYLHRWLPAGDFFFSGSGIGN